METADTTVEEAEAECGWGLGSYEFVLSGVEDVAEVVGCEGVEGAAVVGMVLATFSLRIVVACEGAGAAEAANGLTFS